MSGKAQLYQAITLVVVVLFFDVLERRVPGYAVHRQKGLGLNVLALLVVILGGEGWKILLVDGFRSLIPSHFVSLAAAPLPPLPSIVKISLGVILADLSLYWVHRAMHRTRLWRTHTFHHSIEEIWWLSGSRTSLTHLLLFAIPQTFIAYYLLKLTPWEAGIAFSFGVAVNIWIHTNVQVNLGPLERILITPNFHRIHHGAKGLTGSNLAFVFTFWDKVFGTYADPKVIGEDFAVGFVSTRKRLIRMIVGI